MSKQTLITKMTEGDFVTVVKKTIFYFARKLTFPRFGQNISSDFSWNGARGSRYFVNDISELDFLKITVNAVTQLTAIAQLLRSIKKLLLEKKCDS